MIAECARCSDPIFPYMERCSGCGAENPGFVSAEPPKQSAYTTDEGTEHGLMALGLGGAMAGVKLLGAHGAGSWASWLAALCIVMGLASLAAFRRVTVSDLKPGAKMALRIAMGAAALLFAWAYSLSR
jgi:hypothetical protein